jgi:hypothetical protein
MKIKKIQNVMFKKLIAKTLYMQLQFFKGLMCFHPSSAFECLTMQQNIVGHILKM